MTHDEFIELLAQPAHTMDAHQARNVYLLALQAVVELHKPQEITLPNGEWGANCVKCDGYDYPCETIQAIEKELD
jgi:hypothetical protein